MKDIESCMQQKQCLQDELALWQENDFAKEQYARERLHMKKKEEVVYFIKNNTNS
jgi:cell division protein FtsB